jgi:thiamine-phosphate pyrophosphorylase
MRLQQMVQELQIGGTSPQLYLVTPVVEDAAAFAREMEAALAAAPIAAVLLRLAAADERTLIERIKTLAPAVQSTGAALLLDGHADLAARAGADGAHLDGIDAFLAALSLLKPALIAGAGGLISRHDAMVAAERGTDYVMFGEPDAHGQRPSVAAIEERIAWWAEVFECPCVGYAANLEDVGRLTAAGADFVAIGDWLWSHSGGPAAAIKAARQRMNVETVA